MISIFLASSLKTPVSNLQNVGTLKQKPLFQREETDGLFKSIRSGR